MFVSSLAIATFSRRRRRRHCIRPVQEARGTGSNAAGVPHRLPPRRRVSSSSRPGALTPTSPARAPFCYVLSVPTEKEAGGHDHGDNFFIVSQRPGQNISYEPQAMMGYTVKEMDSKIDGVVLPRASSCLPRTRSLAENGTGTGPCRRHEGGHSMTVNATSRKGTAAIRN